jgi:hypothetical protein
VLLRLPEPDRNNEKTPSGEKPEGVSGEAQLGIAVAVLVPALVLDVADVETAQELSRVEVDEGRWRNVALKLPASRSRR